MTPEEYEYQYYDRIIKILVYGVIVPCVAVIIIAGLLCLFNR